MIRCTLPSPDDHESLPEWTDEWRTSDTCDHAYCAEADYYARLYAGTPKPLTRDERESIEADAELMASEFHGRDTEGKIRWGHV